MDIIYYGTYHNIDKKFNDIEKQSSVGGSCGQRIKGFQVFQPSWLFVASECSCPFSTQVLFSHPDMFLLIVLGFKCKVMGWQNIVNQNVFHDHLRFLAGLAVWKHLRLWSQGLIERPNSKPDLAVNRLQDSHSELETFFLTVLSIKRCFAVELHAHSRSLWINAKLVNGQPICQVFQLRVYNATVFLARNLVFEMYKYTGKHSYLPQCSQT